MKTILAAALAACLAMPAAAQVVCADYSALAQRLAGKYGESIVFAGLRGENQLWQLWMNADTGTWTTIYVTPSNLACVIATGTAGEIDMGAVLGDSF